MTRIAVAFGLAGALALPPSHPLHAQANAPAYQHKLTGFAAGATLGAVVVTLEAVKGSSCIGSGNYLRTCRIGFVGAALVGGGLGTVVGAVLKTDDPPGRTQRVFLGTALGAAGAFLVSLPLCNQEDSSNPGLVCGRDGLVSTPAVLVGATIGGVIGGLTGRTTSALRISHAGPVWGGPSGARVGMAFRWSPPRS